MLFIQTSPFEALYSFFTELSMTGREVVGIVGPRSNPVTEKVAYIFGSKLPVVTVINIECNRSWDDA